MAEDQPFNVDSRHEQEYLLAKIMLTHYGMMHEYFIKQMEYYTIACCNIALPGKFKILPAERYISYEIVTEKTRPLTPKKVKGKKAPAKKKISAKQYAEERKIAAVNLRTWTKKLLSWDNAEIKVVIDGTEE